MGTRADFYVGLGARGEWIGSQGYDGYFLRKDSTHPLWKAQSADEFRALVIEHLLTLKDAGSFAVLAEKGVDNWPWAWDNSSITDHIIVFDSETQKVLDFSPDSKKYLMRWPDMSDPRQPKKRTAKGI